MNERFSFSSSATVGGLSLPNVRLRETDEGSGLRSWQGSARFRVADAPEGFPGSLDTSGRVTVELADGRRGDGFVTSVNFDGSLWIVDLVGTGPVPA
jgi:hypothetical protein